MKTIFILEDNANIREVLEILLSLENYIVVSTCSIKEFHDKSKEVIPDIFLLDVMLPDGSGIDVCNHIRNFMSLSKVPIVMMSAHTNYEEINQKCLPDDFLGKPFDLEVVLEKINTLLS